MRENHARLYSTDAYFIAKNLAETPQYLLLPFLYTTLVYFATGKYTVPVTSFYLRSLGLMGYGVVKWLHFFIISTLMTHMALSVGYAAACIFAHVEIAVQYVSSICYETPINVVLL